MFAEEPLASIFGLFLIGEERCKVLELEGVNLFHFWSDKLIKRGTDDGTNNFEFSLMSSKLRMLKYRQKIRLRI